MTTALKLDCFAILAELERLGVSNAAVARHMEVSKGLVHKWKMDEAEPTYSQGMRLLHLLTTSRPPRSQA
jgi:DNA-binding transcriptional regulator YiaG